MIDLLSILWPAVSAFGLYVSREVAVRHIVRQADESIAQRKHELDLKATADSDRLHRLEAEVKALVQVQNMKGLGR